MAAQSIRIAQLNAERSKAVMSETRKLAEELKLDIICIQEPYTQGGKVLGMPVTSQIVMAGVNPMTVIIVFNRAITTTVNRRLSDEHCVCVEIKSDAGNWILGNQYYQFRDEITIHINKTKKIFRNYENKPVLVLADLNAKSNLWHSRITDAKGEEMETAIQELQVEVLNKPRNPPTWRRAGLSSNIDASLANSEASNRVTNWQVKDNLTTSDHNLILMEINRNEGVQGEIEEMGRSKYNIKKADWEKLKNEINMEIRIGEDINVHQSAKEITRAITTAMHASIPQIKKNTKVRNKQWTEELTRMRQGVRRQRKRYQNAIVYQERLQHLQRYRELKAEYVQKIHDSKMDSWEKFVKDNLETDAWGIPYKLVTEKIKSPTVFSTLKTGEDEETYTKDWKESAETLLKILLPDDDIRQDDEEQRIKRREMAVSFPENNIQTRAFTTNEVEEVVMNLKKNKAPGPDGIKAEIIQKAKDEVIPTLTDLYNICLKKGKFPNLWKRADVVIIKKGEDKDPEDPKSYRPICLLSVLGKILERLLCNRLQEHRQEQGMHPQQYGYRKGKSTEDAINRAMEEVEGADSRYVITLFVDISGAFDNLWWPSLLKRLIDINCPRDLYATIKNYCQDRYVDMLCPNDKISKRISKGCPQGSIFGPTFWDLLMEELLETLDRNLDVLATVAYADDLLLIIEGNSRQEMERKTNNVLIQLNQWCTNNKLTISKKKTTYALMKGNLQRNPIIRMNNTAIRRTNINKYLGIHIDEKQNFSHHIAEVCKKGKNIMMKISRMAQREYKIPLHTVQLYFGSIMASITSYGASVWAERLLLVKPKSTIRSAQRGVLLRLTGAFSTTSLEALCVITGICPLDLTVRQRAANYWLKKGQHHKKEKMLRGRRANTKTEVKNVVKEEWQESWNNSEVGRRTHQLIPNIDNRLAQKHFQPEKGLVHFLSGHGPYPSYLHRFNLKEDEMCTCGAIGTPEHVIFQCRETQQELENERQQLDGLTTEEMLSDPHLFNILNRLTGKASSIAQRNFNR